jgi:hypothetical protein
MVSPIIVTVFISLTDCSMHPIFVESKGVIIPGFKIREKEKGQSFNYDTFGFDEARGLV